MKQEMTAYGTKYNLHCPRCGNDEWSDEVYDSGKNKYRKCMHCGSDVCTDEHTHVGIVTEQPFYEFTPQTYYDIKNELETNTYWRLPK